MSQQFLKKSGSVGAFVLCVGGIYVFYLWYGILQEKITQNEYGLLRERFRYTMAIVFVQCVINALCGLAGMCKVCVVCTIAGITTALPTLSLSTHILLWTFLIAM
eukprot:Opistho-2@260